ncbi:MAG: hypothetical protein MJZ50_00740 [Treponema sp.]|nr:hypothetical protein [Treponema sp.]
MSENINNNENYEEEISLIDLLAVVIRYRKMILIGTFAVALLAGIRLFVLPKVVPSMNRQTQTVSYLVQVEKIPAKLKKELDYRFIENGISFLTDVRAFAQSQKEFKIFADEEKCGSAVNYNYAISNVIKQKKFKVEKGHITDTISVTCDIPVDKLEETNAFMNKFVGEASAFISSELDQTIKELSENTERTLNEYKKDSKADKDGENSMSATVALAKYTDLKNDIDTFYQRHTNYLMVNDDAFIIPVGQGRAKKFIIVVFAVFFVLVFAAFMRNAIENIKKDKEASGIIAKAWEEGK